ncbi:MAG: Gfo/Idh/MocA family oxidoreductase [Candidatus Competibacteraceae bacterium]|nr:Gfo/Idh/MocA family oxidoreductase [Candidatus Competibacteraceae bacterium]
MGDDHWLLDGKAAGGGIVISVSVHRIDLMRFLVGDVKRVSAVGRTSHAAFKNGAEDFVSAVMEFENGAIGEMFGTYSGYRMPWGEMFMIFGERGTIHAVPELGGYLGEARIASADSPHKITGWEDQYAGFEPLVAPDAGLETNDEFVNQLLHFAQCVHTSSEPWSSGRDNLGTMKVVFGIYESLRTGEAVDLASL